VPGGCAVPAASSFLALQQLGRNPLRPAAYIYSLHVAFYGMAALEDPEIETAHDCSAFSSTMLFSRFLLVLWKPFFTRLILKRLSRALNQFSGDPYFYVRHSTTARHFESILLVVGSLLLITRPVLPPVSPLASWFSLCDAILHFRRWYSSPLRLYRLGAWPLEVLLCFWSSLAAVPRVNPCGLILCSFLGS